MQNPTHRQHRIPVGRVVLFHGVIGAAVVLVCVLAALYAAWGYEVLESLGPAEEFVPTPYFRLFAVRLGVVLGVVSSVYWCARVVADRRKWNPRFRPMGLAIVVAMMATVVLHAGLVVAQGLLREEPIRWENALFVGGVFGSISALVSGAVLGGMGYYWSALAIFGEAET